MKKFRKQHRFNTADEVVFLVLFISLLTSFALGLLITHSLFGTGLHYFAEIAKEAKGYRAHAFSQTECDNDCWYDYERAVNQCERAYDFSIDEGFEGEPQSCIQGGVLNEECARLSYDRYIQCLSVSQINFQNCRSFCKTTSGPSGGSTNKPGHGRLFDKETDYCIPDQPSINCLDGSTRTIY